MLVATREDDAQGERDAPVPALRLTSRNLHEQGIADEGIPEPPGGAHQDWDGAALALKEALLRHLGELRGLPLEELVERRRAKFEGVGAWRELDAAPAAGEVRAGA